MIKIDTEELKQIEIGILDCIDDFCKKNNIKYWIDCGTLLGAVRHKGFIPWDDDIDIGMLREDYEKFTKEFNDFNKRYKFHCYENDKNWNYLYGKVLDTETVLYEPNKKEGNESAVFVDVFVYDNAENDNKKNLRYLKKRDFLSKLNKLQLYKNFYTISKRKYNFIRYPLHLITNVLPKRIFLRKMCKNLRSIGDENSEYFGNFSSGGRTICKKSIFNEVIMKQFEKKEYPVPKGYDELLTLHYGNYMEIPAKEKQISNHVFEAYYRENK